MVPAELTPPDPPPGRPRRPVVHARLILAPAPGPAGAAPVAPAVRKGAADAVADPAPAARPEGRTASGTRSPAPPSPAGAAPPRARVEEISLSRPWVANLSTALVVAGGILLLLALIRVV